MALDEFKFDPADGWLNESTFPDYPEREQVRPLHQRLFNQIKTYLGLVRTEVNTHTAESVSEQIRVTRDLSLDGTQTITLARSKIPKQIRINCCVNDSIKASIGTWSDGDVVGSCIFTYGASHLWARNVGGIVRIAETTTTIRTNGSISNVKKGSFDIIWLKNSTGATGTADLFIDVSYHE